MYEGEGWRRGGRRKGRKGKRRRERTEERGRREREEGERKAYAIMLVWGLFRLAQIKIPCNTVNPHTIVESEAPLITF